METNSPEEHKKGFPADLPAVVAAIFSLAAIFGFLIWAISKGDSLVGLLKEQTFIVQFPVIVGIPFSSVVAFIVVSLLRYTSGPIEFEVIGFKFKDASGPVVMWILCFLALILGIKTLWQDPSTYLKGLFPG